MKSERDQGSSNNTVEENKGKIESWSQLSYLLPEEINPHITRFVRGYFDAQIKIAEKRKTKARIIFRGLENDVDYSDFEEKNQPLLAAIDIVVRGKTNRSSLIEPSLKNIKD